MHDASLCTFCAVYVIVQVTLESAESLPPPAFPFPPFAPYCSAPLPTCSQRWSSSSMMR